jgi:hypothetical protein
VEGKAGAPIRHTWLASSIVASSDQAPAVACLPALSAAEGETTLAEVGRQAGNLSRYSRD